MYPQCFPEGADMIDALDFYFQVNGNKIWHWISQFNLIFNNNNHEKEINTKNRIIITNTSLSFSFVPLRWPVNQEVSWGPLWLMEGSVQSQGSVFWVLRRSATPWVSCTHVGCMTFLDRWPFMWVVLTGEKLALCWFANV